MCWLVVAVVFIVVPFFISILHTPYSMLHRLAHIHIFHNVYRYMFVLFKHKNFTNNNNQKILFVCYFKGHIMGVKGKGFFLLTLRFLVLVLVVVVGGVAGTIKFKVEWWILYDINKYISIHFICFSRTISYSTSFSIFHLSWQQQHKVGNNNCFTALNVQTHTHTFPFFYCLRYDEKWIKDIVLPYLPVFYFLFV